MAHPFTLLRPASLAQASDMLLECGDDARPIAGGTALQIFRQLGLLRVPYLVDLSTIPGLSGITVDHHWLTIGAMTSMREVERSPIVRERLPVLAETYARVANMRIRSTATVGGNLSHGDYRLDPPAILLPLKAEVRTTKRTLPLADFFVGLEETALEPGELVTAVRLPVTDIPDRSVFWKFASLAANDWPCFGAGVCLWLDEAGRCREARVGITAMSPTSLLIALPMLAGRKVDEDAASEAGKYVAERVDPIPDLRGSVEYKRRIAAVCTADAVLAAWRRTNGAG